MYLGETSLGVKLVLLIAKCETFEEFCDPLISSFLVYKLEKWHVLVTFMVEVPGIWSVGIRVSYYPGNPRIWSRMRHLTL